MNNRHFENWKNSVDIDHLSLYIKTWLAFLSTAQVMYPNHITESGDGSVMSAYKEDLSIPMSFNDIMLPQIQKIYTIGYQVIERDVPNVFFANFFNLNKDYILSIENQLTKYKMVNGSREYYKSSLKIEYKDLKDGSSNPNLLFTIKSTDPRFNENLNCYHLCFNVLLEDLIDPIEFHTRRFLDLNILFEYFMEQMKIQLHNKVEGIEDLTLEEIEERKGYCNGLIMPLMQLVRQQFHVKDLFQSLPLDGFPNGFQINNNQLKILHWFISFNYNIRNLLFHSIINPFDQAWLTLFKSSYLALRELVEYNINKLNELNTDEINS